MILDFFFGLISIFDLFGSLARGIYLKLRVKNY